MLDMKQLSSCMEECTRVRILYYDAPITKKDSIAIIDCISDQLCLLCVLRDLLWEFCVYTPGDVVVKWAFFSFFYLLLLFPTSTPVLSSSREVLCQPWYAHNLARSMALIQLFIGQSSDNNVVAWKETTMTTTNNSHPSTCYSACFRTSTIRQTLATEKSKKATERQFRPPSVYSQLQL